MYDIIQRKLNQYFGLTNSETLPEKRERSRWVKENILGFLLGIARYGEVVHVSELQQILSLSKKEEINSRLMDFNDRMYLAYIQPFKQHNGSCSGTRDGSAKSSGRIKDPSNLKHKDLKKALIKRDAFCLFCWEARNLQGAHIIAQRNSDPSIFERAGLSSKHQVQNGLLLCQYCHSEFNSLRYYVEELSDKLVLKTIDYSTGGDREITRIKGIRSVLQGMEQKLADRNVVERKDEVVLYFADNDISLQPCTAALKLHKTACLIWKMAGGADPEEEECPDDYEDVDMAPAFHLKHDNVLSWIRASGSQ